MTLTANFPITSEDVTPSLEEALAIVEKARPFLCKEETDSLAQPRLVLER